MCFIDTDGMGARSPLSRRGFLGGLVAGAAAAASLGGSLVLPGVAAGAEPAPAGGGPGAAGVSFKWFGTNGWEITFGNKTILVIPGSIASSRVSSRTSSTMTGCSRPTPRSSTST